MEVLPFSNYVRVAATSRNYSQVEDIFALTLNKLATVKYQGQGYKLASVYGATPNIEHFININIFGLIN